MSEEEKKAIKWLKELYDIEKDFNSSKGKEESNIIKTLLNLIEKQQEEIKKLELVIKTIPEKMKILADSFNEKVLDTIANNKALDNYISKDKIREHKKWYEDTCENLSKNGYDLDRFDQYQGIIHFCNELLKEE